jgi:hypothetical protein
MSEDGDWTPGKWEGYDFEEAKKKYKKSADRSYEEAVVQKKVTQDFLPALVKTDCKRPLIIVCDVTASMGEWPAVIFSKLPLLDLEGKEYLGDQKEICFAAIGDANSDKYPMQVRPFCNGLDMVKALKDLVIEGDGGHGNRETYEFMALYLARNAQVSKSAKPVVIFIGDEMFYDRISAVTAKKCANVALSGDMDSRDVFEELKQKFAVYIIRKPYGRGRSGGFVAPEERAVHAQWVEVLGEDHVCILSDPARVVDVIFGILSKETSREEYFKEEIAGRQKPEQVNQVMKSLDTVLKLEGSPPSSKVKPL